MRDPPDQFRAYERCYSSMYIYVQHRTAKVIHLPLSQGFHTEIAANRPDPTRPARQRDGRGRSFFRSGPYGRTCSDFHPAGSHVRIPISYFRSMAPVCPHPLITSPRSVFASQKEKACIPNASEQYRDKIKVSSRPTARRGMSGIMNK